MTDCVLLADRHQELSECLRALLRSRFEGVFAVTDTDSLLRFATLIQPTLVVVDLPLAGGDLAAFLRDLKLWAPATKVLLLSVHDEPTVVSTVLAAGADGVLPKRAIATEFLDAVETVLASRCYVPPALTDRRPARAPRPPGPGMMKGESS